MNTFRFAHRSGFCLGTLPAVLLAIAAAAAAQTPGEWQHSLDGQWLFTTNTAAPELPTTHWDTIRVPGNWDTSPAYSTYKGKGWYRKDFAVPADWEGKHIRLQFDAVYHEAQVHLNGKDLGAHVGGYTPFEFDVTGFVHPGATNTLVVSADNTYRRGAWWAWGGISRSVKLVAYNEVRIVRQHIRSEPDLATGTAQLFVRYTLANTASNAVELTLESRLDASGETVLRHRATIPAGEQSQLALRAGLPREMVRLWHFDHPHLYRLTTSIKSGDRVLHQRSDRFGIRKVELTRDSLLFNGERVRLNGYNRVSDSRRFGNTEPDQLVMQDVDLMKRANGNLARLMHVPQAPNLLDCLDEKGMLIWCEIPVWGGDDPQVKNPDNALNRQWMREMIERDYNHPCIIGWSVGNEMTGHFAYVSNMIAYTRSLDPHRIVTHVSYTGARAEYHPANDPITVSPIVLYNTYSPGQDTSAILHAKWPDKPIFYSEFGIKQFGALPEARIEGLEAMYRRATAGHPYVVGVALWTYNDYRSDYRGTPASGNREWGIVDEERRPKAAFWQARKLFSPVAALTVTNGVIRVQPRGVDEVPSFTLRGYKLRWSGGELALPDLKPGDAAWVSDRKVPPGTVVKLITPTGYDVAESE